MRKQNPKITVHLDVVPERRTERFPPRFRPVGHFSEPRFRAQLFKARLSRQGGRDKSAPRPYIYI